MITKIKSNMKNTFMNTYEKLMLRKRAVIESLAPSKLASDELKKICQIAHTRHRSPANFFVNLISGIVAYSFLPKKPSLHLDKNFLMAS